MPTFQRIWEHVVNYFVGLLNVVLGVVTWTEGAVIPHVMIWGGLGLLAFNWWLAVKRRNDDRGPL